jgi:hypothetical protein
MWIYLLIIKTGRENFMIQILNQDGLYLRGSIVEIVSQLSIISKHFKTVKEYIDYKTKYLNESTG